MTTTPLPPQYPSDQSIPIPEQGTWPESVHRFDELSVAALRAAEATGRPLLIRGEAGVGKSQTARAAAAFAKRLFIPTVIDGRTEPHDLMWHFDAVARLAAAQDPPPDGLPPASHYVIPGCLWQAYDWIGAQRQREAAEALQGGASAGQSALARGEFHVDVSMNWDPAHRRAVLLIDEIDKADPELPNALLEVLGNSGFRPPYGLPPVICHDDKRPLVIFTTNEERELPRPFLRRCLVLELKLPDDLVVHWVAVGRSHLDVLKSAGKVIDGAVSDDVLTSVAVHVVSGRKNSARHAYRPGTSEFLDIVKALATLWPGQEKVQKAQMSLIGRFTLSKSAADY